MSITRWDPFRDLLSLQEKMNRLFDDSLSRTKRPDENHFTGAWIPAVDIYETEGEVIVKAELPGVPKEEISVEVKENVLTLRGERKLLREVKEENYHRLERNYGKFQRSFHLPVEVDRDNIKAHFKNGVLEVNLPRSEKTKPKQIDVVIK